MARITPDGNTKVHEVPTIASESAPTMAEINAGTELTPFLTPAGLDTPDEGQEADSSDLSSARDKSVPSTIGGQPQGEFYRDDAADDAWDALPRLTTGYLVIARFGGTGTDNAIQATDVVEVWPIRVSNRNNVRIARGETLRFAVNFALSGDPTLNAVVA